MNRRSWMLALTAILLAGTLTGCRYGTMDTMQETLEHAAQNVLSSAPQQNATLTPEEAEAIALAHAGFTASEVTGLRSEYEINDGIPHYDVQFRKGLTEYEYEIHAQSGAVLSYDQDD